MIRPLRQIHRAMILVLTVLLFALFVAALIVRKPAPANPQFPIQLLPTPARGQR